MKDFNIGEWKNRLLKENTNTNIKGILRKEEYNDDEWYYVESKSYLGDILLHRNLLNQLGDKINNLVGKEGNWEVEVWNHIGDKPEYRVTKYIDDKDPAKDHFAKAEDNLYKKVTGEEPKASSGNKFRDVKEEFYGEGSNPVQDFLEQIYTLQSEENYSKEQSLKFYNDLIKGIQRLIKEKEEDE